MEFLKKYFPLSFKEKRELKELVVNILIYLAIAVVFGAMIAIFSTVPVMKWIIGVLGAFAGIYAVCGAALTVYNYIQSIK